MFFKNWFLFFQHLLIASTHRAKQSKNKEQSAKHKHYVKQHLRFVKQHLRFVKRPRFIFSRTSAVAGVLWEVHSVQAPLLHQSWLREGHGSCCASYMGGTLVGVWAHGSAGGVERYNNSGERKTALGSDTLLLWVLQEACFGGTQQECVAALRELLWRSSRGGRLL